MRVSTCEQSACAMVTGPGRGRHLEQPDWVAGTQDVSSTETPHPAGDDLRILRQRSHPPTAAITGQGEDVNHNRPACQPGREQDVPRDDGAAGNAPSWSCPIPFSRERCRAVLPLRLGWDATPRHVRGLTGAEHALRAGADVAARSSNATEGAAADAVMRRDVGARKGVVRKLVALY